MGSIFMRFPGGKDKALTLSYDDGVDQDIRLIEIMRRYGLKGTFNLNSGLFTKEGTVFPQGYVQRRMTHAQVLAAYQGDDLEVAVHGLTHPFLEKLPANICTYEVLQDRINLEKDFHCLVRGMAYPYGTYSDEVVNALKSCGIVYARTIESRDDFAIPTDWLRMPTTCHHNDPKLMDLADRFLHEKDRYGRPKLFYLWGHSYEFERDDNWHIIEDFAAYISGKEDVWYATNIEIYDYVQAYHQLVFSVAEKRVYNPSCKDVYFYVNGKTFCAKAGETICFEAAG